MKMLIMTLIAVMTTCSAWALGTGLTTYPLMQNQHLFSGEMTGVLGTGEGVGLQARYTRKVSSGIKLDGGAGISTGDRSMRLFTGADFEIFPDFGRQPRVSLKTSFEFGKEFDQKKSIFGLSPIVSKGLNFWGNEAFPYLALPIELNLQGSNQTYQSQIAMALGVNGHLPIDGYRHLVANFEAQFSLKDSASGVFLGLSYQL